MINYIRFYFRNLKKDSFYSFLNIFGLAIGLASCIIIFLYLRNELSYDHDHKNADKIYRISSNYITSGKDVIFAVSSPALGEKLLDEYPEIEKYLRIDVNNNILFHFEDKSFYEDGIAIADSTVFDFFDHELIVGNPKFAMTDPNTIVLSESLAKKYFSDDDPLGKVITLNNGPELTVTGVFKDLSQNRHVKYKALIPISTFDPNNDLLNWPLFEVWPYFYVLINQSFTMDAFWEKWPAFYEKYAKDDGESYGQTLVPIFEKLPDVHFSTGFRGDLPLGNKSYIYAFSFIGIFLLILMCINYVNLATARASQRLKEIGMKKTVGSTRGKLRFQFLSEAILNALISLVLALGIVEFVLSFTRFNELLEVSLSIGFSGSLEWFFFSIALALFIGIMAGLYPSLFLSSLNCVDALNGIYKSGKKELILRRILVVLQFSLSIIVISSTLLMNNQINYLRGFDLGFDQENIMVVPANDTLIRNSFDMIKEKLEQHADIMMISTGYSRPGSPSGGLYRFENNEGTMEEHNIPVFFVRYEYLDVLGIELIEGRNFDKDIETDMTGAILVNETLIEFMNWDNALGKKITQGQGLQAKVVGVVKDFNFKSLHSKIDPLIIRLQFREEGRLLIKIRNTDPKDVIEYVDDVITEVNPEKPFNYSFLDEDFDKAYKIDQAQNKLLQYFSIICIIISCLGLFGLSSYSISKRTKEIGIRKSMGSSAKLIVILLSKEIIGLVSVALLISTPVVYFIIDTWGNNFAYKASFNFLLLILSLLGIMIIAFLTVSYHSVKASFANPADCLRYE